MQLPKSFRSLSVVKHEKGEKSETLIEGSFYLKIQGDSRLLGDFPRRVRLGDSLAFFNDKKVLSPANGIAVIHEDETSSSFIKITQDGNLEPTHDFREVAKDRNVFFNTLEANGIHSLDFDSIPLDHYLQTFWETKNSVLILTPITRYNQPNFKSILKNDYKKDMDSLVSYLQDIFPGKEIRLIWDEVSSKPRYPLGIPEYFADYVGGYSLLGKNPKDLGRVFLLGGETLFHLLRGVFYDIPFTRRHLTVHCVDRHGRLDGRERVFFLSNGQSFHFLHGIFSKEYKFISLDHYTQESRILKRDDVYHFDIFENSQIVFYSNHPKSRVEFPCTECKECNVNCPTHANPMGLFSIQNSFHGEDCIHCGLCTLYCPSGIDLRSRIQSAISEVVKS